VDKLNPMTDTKKTNYQKEGGINLDGNVCCNCKEGTLFGEKVYCNIDGRFHPLRDNFECKSFVPKKNEKP